MSFISGLGSIGSFLGGASDLFGGIFGGKSSKKIAKENLRLQKEAFYNGITHRVADAKNAGVHPLFALGANVNSPAPVSAGDDHSAGIGNGLREMGQSISRSTWATRTQEEREKALFESTLAKDQAQIEYVKSQTALNLANANPALPSNDGREVIQGQGNSRPSATGGLIEVIPDDLVSHRRNDRSLTASSPKPANTEFVNRDGSVTFYPSKQVKESIEDVLPYELDHFYRNRISPHIDRYTIKNKYSPLYYMRKAANHYWKSQRR